MIVYLVAYIGFLLFVLVTGALLAAGAMGIAWCMAGVIWWWRKT